MQGLRLDEPRSNESGQSPIRSVTVSAVATPTLLDTLQHLRDLQGNLLQLARALPAASFSPAEGPSPGAIRVRRARQAAALQGAVHVLQELLREQEFIGNPLAAR
jgi:hypothetical protein